MIEQKSRESIEHELRVKSLKDLEFRQQLINAPKSAIESALGITLPGELEVRVVEETPTSIALAVPPALPETTNELSDQQLEAVSGGGTPATVATIVTGIWTDNIIDEVTKW